jgi:hypothetical protein
MLTTYSKATEITSLPSPLIGGITEKQEKRSGGMSGYRSLHRETILPGGCPIWQVATTRVLGGKALTSAVGGSAAAAGTVWRVWTACGDGLIRGFLIQEKSISQKTEENTLDASACSCSCTHVLVGPSQKEQFLTPHDSHSKPEEGGPPEEEQHTAHFSTTAFGCTQVRTCRNYVGEDSTAGDLLVASLDLSGTVRLWSLPEDMDEERITSAAAAADPQQQQLLAAHEFLVEDATGTFLHLCPANVAGDGDVKLAVACLDGSIAIVATGLTTPKSTKEASTAGTILERWASRDASGSIALSGEWHPTKRNCLALGRQDGLVEIFGEAGRNSNTKKHCRLAHHEAPVRALAFTPDGHLLISGSDDGMLCLWDVSRSSIVSSSPLLTPPVLVHHAVRAHASWILALTPLHDSRRFVSCGSDRRLHVWSVGQMDQASHTFTTDETVWTIDATKSLSSNNKGPIRQSSSNALPPRLVSGREDGSLQIFSLE